MIASCAFVVRGNIERYRRLIAEERDEGRRRTIKQLLVEAEQEMRAIEDQERHHPPDGAASRPTRPNYSSDKGFGGN